MSLVGSEVAIVEKTPWKRTNRDRGDDGKQQLRLAKDSDSGITSTQCSPDESTEDLHPPVTPPSAFESMFLADLPTQNISAAVLAQELNQAHRASSWLAGTSTLVEDDYATAMQHSTQALTLGTDDDDDDDDVEDDYDLDNDNNRYGRDALAHSRDLALSTPSPKSRHHRSTRTDPLSREISMATKSSSSKTPTKTSVSKATMVTSTSSTTTTAPSNVGGADPMLHVDAAEKIYSGAKGAWAWGKGIIVFSPFLGLAEGVAGKVVEMAGTSLPDIDGVVTDKLQDFDDGLLNPAIESVVGVILGAASQTHDVLKPVVVSVLKPIGLIKEEADPELTT